MLGLFRFAGNDKVSLLEIKAFDITSYYQLPVVMTATKQSQYSPKVGSV
ncbi:hypothetical protein PN499_22690 [Kamptonema animale CS-326]|jgi:hypothetical protein|nr:hypothetical protein [Kamptonema animale]MDB9514010.1 hypothetical protein [Kamptonema animale CS-326]